MYEKKNTRQIAAAKRCSTLLTSLAKVVRRPVGTRDEQGLDEQYNERIRLDDELAVESLYLPEDARRRVNLARSIFLEAKSLVDEVGFYEEASSITLDVADHLNEVLAAHIKGEPLPELTEMMSHLARALNYQDEQRHSEYLEELQENRDRKRQWLERYPPFPARVAPQPDGRFAFLLRRLKRG